MGGKVAQGTLLQRETSLGSGSYVTVANVKSWDGPSTEASELETTDLNSLAKEFLPGLQDFGDLSLEVNFDPNNATHQQAMTDIAAGTVTGWRIQFQNPTINWRWPAFVKSCPVSGEADGIISASITLRLAGDRTVS